MENTTFNYPATTTVMELFLAAHQSEAKAIIASQAFVMAARFMEMEPEAMMAWLRKFQAEGIIRTPEDDTRAACEAFLMTFADITNTLSATT